MNPLWACLQESEKKNNFYFCEKCSVHWFTQEPIHFRLPIRIYIGNCIPVCICKCSGILILHTHLLPHPQFRDFASEFHSSQWRNKEMKQRFCRGVPSTFWAHQITTLSTDVTHRIIVGCRLVIIHFHAFSGHSFPRQRLDHAISLEAVALSLFHPCLPWQCSKQNCVNEKNYANIGTV